MKNVKLTLETWIKQNYIGIMALFVSALAFYLQIVNAGISTHDELNCFKLVQSGEYWNSICWTRWGTALTASITNIMQCTSNNYWIYRLFTMIGLLSSCCTGSALIYHHVDKMMANIFPILFWGFAQLNLDHCGFISFGFSYQLSISFLFVSIDLFLFYLKNRKKCYLVSSAIFYLIVCMFYEAFVLFGILFFVIDLIYWYEKKEISIKHIYYDIYLHAILAVVFTLSWFIVGKFIFPSATDATIDLPESGGIILRVIIRYAVALFPLAYSPYGFKELIVRSMEVSSENLVRWCLGILLACVVVYMVTKVKQLSLKKYGTISAICFIGMVLPSVLLSLNAKFSFWRSFGTSYYSYFFIIGWLLMTICLLYQKLPGKKLYLGLLFLCVTFVSVFTSISNRFYAEQLAANQVRYELFDSLVRTDYFGEIEDESIIYTEDYQGIHLMIDSLSEYATAMSGTNVTVLNEKKDIDYSKNVYHLRYDKLSKSIFLYKVDQNGSTDEVFVLSKNKLNNYEIVAQRTGKNKISILSVDGKAMGIYEKYIIVPYIDENRKNALIQCEGMQGDSFGILYGSNSGTSLSTTEGIYQQESWGRWAQKECSIIYDNLEADSVMNVKLVIATPGEPGAEVAISCGKFEQNIQADGQEEISLDIPISEGKNEIRFVSSAPDIVAPADPREMNIQILKMELTINGHTIKINNPS